MVVNVETPVVERPFLLMYLLRRLYLGRTRGGGAPCSSDGNLL
jgi:hypothetical protein